MIVVVFGATGMVGQGVLRECLLDRGVDEVRSIVIAPVLAGPGLVTSTDRVGRAMLEVARRGASDPIVESRAINELAARALAA